MPYDEHPEDDELRKTVEFIQGRIRRGEFAEIPTALLKLELAKYDEILKRDGKLIVPDSMFGHRRKVLERNKVEDIAQRIRNEIKKRPE